MHPHPNEKKMELLVRRKEKVRLARQVLGEKILSHKDKKNPNTRKKKEAATTCSNLSLRGKRGCLHQRLKECMRGEKSRRDSKLYFLTEGVIREDERFTRGGTLWAA